MNTKFWMVALTLVTALSAQAGMVLGKEHPVAAAKMTEVDADGHEIGISLEKVLTLNKRDEVQFPTSFTLVEEMRVMCIVAPCPQPKEVKHFFNVSLRSIGCGSVEYTASRPLLGFSQPNHGMPRPIPTEVLKVVDHRYRLCDDYRPFMWEATITSSFRSVRHMHGNPKDVMTAQ